MNEDYGSSDEGWQELEEETFSNTSCLFCEHLFESPQLTFEHCRMQHNFNISKIKRQFNLDCFSYIKMINYIRSHKLNSEQLASGNVTPQCWQSDEHMVPVMQDDPLLMFDIEDCDDGIDSNVGLDDELVMMKRSEYNALMQRLAQAENRAKDIEEAFATASQDMAKMRELAQNYLLNPAVETNVNNSASNNSVSEDDATYFSAYAHFSIHLDMLQDHIRTESYRDALWKNADLFQGKVILDVGCGTGILSMFAAKAGAKRVIAVDQSDIIYHAMDIIRENKLDNSITLIKGRIEDVELPVDQVDVIISEWMGYFLLFESMLDSVIYARDKYLSPKGYMIPDRCTISLVGINDLERHRKCVAFWDNVYGYKMSCMKGEVVKEASVELVGSSSVVTTVALIKDLDMMTCAVSDLEFTSSFTLSVLENAPLVALVGYFDIYFNLNNKIHFSTSPSSPPTHWKQTVFYLEEPIYKHAGETLECKLTCRRKRKDPRSLVIVFDIEGKSYTYLLD